MSDKEKQFRKELSEMLNITEAQKSAFYSFGYQLANIGIKEMKQLKNVNVDILYNGYFHASELYDKLPIHKEWLNKIKMQLNFEKPAPKHPYPKKKEVFGTMDAVSVDSDKIYITYINRPNDHEPHWLCMHFGKDVPKKFRESIVDPINGMGGVYADMYKEKDLIIRFRHADMMLGFAKGFEQKLEKKDVSAKLLMQGFGASIEDEGFYRKFTHKRLENVFNTYKAPELFADSSLEDSDNDKGGNNSKNTASDKQKTGKNDENPVAKYRKESKFRRKDNPQIGLW